MRVCEFLLNTAVCLPAYTDVYQCHISTEHVLYTITVYPDKSSPVTSFSTLISLRIRFEYVLIRKPPNRRVIRRNLETQ